MRPARPACWPAAPIARCSSGCGSWPRAHLVAAARRRRPLQQLAHQVQAWRSLTASSRTSTRCGAGTAGTMLARRRSRAAARVADPGHMRTWSARRAGTGRLQQMATRCRPGDRSRLKQDVDQVRRRRGRHAGQRRRSRAAARAADPGRARTWSPRRAGAGRCSSWPTRCRPGDRSPPQAGRRPGAAPARPARCWPGADRALQPVLQILATCAPGQRGAPAACCSWITRYCTAFGWNAVAVLLESNKAKDQRTDQQMQSKGSSTSPRGFERSEPGQDMRR